MPKSQASDQQPYSGIKNCWSCANRWDGFNDKLHLRFDYWMESKLHMEYRKRMLAFHFLDQLKEQIWAVLPISFLLIFVIGVFFQQSTKNPGQTAYGLLCAILGLMFFMEGLRVCVMPLGEMVGSRLPLKYPLWVVLLVAGCLGILVTYAEPAISSLSPLAQLVDKTKAPYLYYALNQQREMLVLSIGLGVGLAAVVGTLRFVKGWSLKPIIYTSLVPAIGLACYMQWGNPDLSPLLGLAWDCGAVTTGPVTVPILLAMGIGVMKSQRQKRLAKAAYQNAVDTNTGQTLEGFGVVTLASLFPVIAVEIMGIMISVTTTKEEIINSAYDGTSTNPVDQSPVREVIFAIRAILPLITALLLLVIFVIREPIPHLTAYTVARGVGGPDDSGHGSISGASRTGSATGRSGGGADSSMGGSIASGAGGGGGGGGARHGMSPLGKESRGNAGKERTGGGGGGGLERRSCLAKRSSAGVGATSISLTIATTMTDADTENLPGGGRSGSASGGSDSDAPPPLPVPPPPSAPPPPPAAPPPPEADAAADPDTDPEAELRPKRHPPALEIPAGPAAAPGSGSTPTPAAAAALADPEAILHQHMRRSVDAALHPHPHPSGADAGAAPLEPRMDRQSPALPGKGAAEAAADNKPDVEDHQAIQVFVDGQLVPEPKEPWYRKHGGLIVGIILAQGGMIAFNIGLTYGFTSLGDQAGTLLPAAYLALPYEPLSPYYGYVGGIILVLMVAFCLGFLATRAEPALRVLGKTVQHLSQGAFTANMLVYAVSVGVGVGMAVGSTKILFGVPIIYIILAKYSVAVAITFFSPEDFTNIAWDSAGVTTGPVTVPFVLSLGIGFSKATGATEGFGILTAASVAPIISVLLTNLLKKPAKALLRSVSTMSRLSRFSSTSRAQSMSRGSLAVFSKRAKRHKDTDQALTQVAAIVAAAARLEAKQQAGLASPTLPRSADGFGPMSPGPAGPLGSPFGAASSGLTTAPSALTAAPSGLTAAPSALPTSASRLSHATSAAPSAATPLAGEASSGLEAGEEAGQEAHMDRPSVRFQTSD